MTRPRSTLAILVLALALASCARPAQPAPASPAAHPQQVSSAATPDSRNPARQSDRAAVSPISLGDFFALQQSDQALIYDARQAFFYHLGHIPGAINLSQKQCDAAITARAPEIRAALAAGKTIVVYCSSSTCPDARTVATHLANSGYPARVFPGGWEEWRTADLTNQ